ncbi:trimeric intracellular cation channel family protein [Mobilicoccus massiliensis]|uniref:trimeric intracellular cation channel family protein n=1 Tax=Mobilicoccus massiliensis TaxID=1522310 RepID=UPI00058DA9C0|nr:TRIC cation channel family protein [Mobilicoccus massiliensis]
MTELDPSLLLTVDLLGVFCFALSGCLLATSRRFDVVGSLLLGGLTGLGGGIMRDVIIGIHAPTAFGAPIYLVPPLLAAAVVRLGWLTPGRFRRTLLMFDAGGLALFCVSGTLIALEHGLNAIGATLMGVTTAVGGGLLRDIVAREVPQVIRPDGGLYAVPAAVGASLVALTDHLGFNPYHRVGPVEILVIVLVVGFRGLALRQGWQLPLAGPSTPRRPPPS